MRSCIVRSSAWDACVLTGRHTSSKILGLVDPENLHLCCLQRQRQGIELHKHMLASVEHTESAGNYALSAMTSAASVLHLLSLLVVPDAQDLPHYPGGASRESVQKMPSLLCPVIVFS